MSYAALSNTSLTTETVGEVEMRVLRRNAVRPTNTASPPPSLVILESTRQTKKIKIAEVV
jgi:hypothetical protein